MGRELSVVRGRPKVSSTVRPSGKTWATSRTRLFLRHSLMSETITRLDSSSTPLNGSSRTTTSNSPVVHMTYHSRFAVPVDKVDVR